MWFDSEVAIDTAKCAQHQPFFAAAGNQQYDPATANPIAVTTFTQVSTGG